MLFSKSSPRPRHQRRQVGATIVLAACALASTSLGALTLGSESAGAASTTVILHFYQKQTALTFYNASGVAIEGYPPVGGHVREDDVDYVGTFAHHANKVSVSDHLYCTVISAPANATCAYEFAIGGSLIYADDLHGNLASSSPTTSFPVTGGTGQYAGVTGTSVGTSIGNTNNSNIVITLHR